MKPHSLGFKPQGSREHREQMWLGLMIGNSRLHWGLFVGEVLICVWDTNYVSVDVMQQLADGQIGSDFPPEICLVSPPVPLFFASVVPAQTNLWGSYPNVSLITLEQVPLENMYPTLGIDRALAVWGAGENWGFPVLVIDAGTALTFTGADCNCSLLGGAILPGLGLQLATLAGKTGQLPSVELPQQLPQRYALNTQEAMQSGVIYTVLAGVKDFVEAWWHSQPQGNVVITGGDSQILLAHLQSQFPEITARLIREPNLVLWGIQKLVMGH